MGAVTRSCGGAAGRRQHQRTDDVRVGVWRTPFRWNGRRAGTTLRRGQSDVLQVECAGDGRGRPLSAQIDGHSADDHQRPAVRSLPRNCTLDLWRRTRRPRTCLRRSFDNQLQQQPGHVQTTNIRLEGHGCRYRKTGRDNGAGRLVALPARTAAHYITPSAASF